MFFIHSNSFAGVATAEPLRDNKIVKAINSGTITLLYQSGSIDITCSVGDEFSIGGSCTGVTSSALMNIILS